MGLDKALTMERMDDFAEVDGRRSGTADERTITEATESNVCARTDDFAWNSANSQILQPKRIPVNSLWTQSFKTKSSQLLSLVQESLKHATKFHPSYTCLLNNTSCVTCKDLVSSQDRNKAVKDLRCLHVFYHFTPETFALAINLLDRFLDKVKVRPKYLSCVAVSCYFIAIKTCEESQNVPRLDDLLTIGQCAFKSSDILRMESIILEKLNFDLNAVTPLRFLQYYFSILVNTHPWLSSYLMVEVLISRLEVCLSHVSAASCQAHILALSILHHALQEYDLLQDVAMRTTWIQLQAVSKVIETDLKHCHRNVKNILHDYLNLTSRTPKLRLQWRMSSRTLSQITRPSYEGYSELPIIFERKPFMFGNKTSETDESCEVDDTEMQNGRVKSVGLEEKQRQNRHLFVGEP